jgi:hypothetical protein
MGAICYRAANLALFSTHFLARNIVSQLSWNIPLTLTLSPNTKACWGRGNILWECC